MEVSQRTAAILAAVAVLTVALIATVRAADEPNAQAQIDGIPAQIDMVEPTDSKSPAKRSRVITATLTDAQRNSVVPGLNDIIDGPIKLELTRIDDDRQAVKIDLGKAALTVPWIGWSKGSGIPATAQFEASGPDSQTALKNFVLKGDGFGVSGDLVVSKGGLTSANFSSVKLSALDDFALSVKHGKSGAYDISISGDSADLRPVLARLKASSSGGNGGSADDSSSATVRANIDKVIGFNDESIRNLKGVYSVSGGHIVAADFSGLICADPQGDDGGVRAPFPVRAGRGESTIALRVDVARMA